MHTNVGTHTTAYVYNYGDFRGNPKKLLLKYFDVFFYISNWGSVRLMLKYNDKSINMKKLKKYQKNDLIEIEQHKEKIILNIMFDDETCGRWVDGEGYLVELLPLYEEIENQNYQILDLMLAMDDNTFDSKIKNCKLSKAQEVFIGCTGF